MSKCGLCGKVRALLPAKVRRLLGDSTPVNTPISTGEKPRAKPPAGKS